MSQSFVSVVIPAYNCEKTIARAVEAVLNQLEVEAEVIVVDDGSNDSTAEIVRSLAERSESVRLIRQENQGPAVARNRGVREARGEIVFFTDSDCVPHRDWLLVALRGFEREDVAAVAGSYGIANPESLLARCIHEEIRFRHLKLMPRFVKSFGSYNVAIRKSFFEKVGGFDEGYRFASGEDNDLSYKIGAAGGKILFEPKVLVDHHHPVSVGRYLKEQFRHGFWRVKMYREHPQMMAGDDYTFWKDILEIPFSILAVLFCFAALFSGGRGIIFFVYFILGFAGVEVWFGFVTQKTLLSKIYFAQVMWLRAFARTFGFLFGGFRFFIFNNKKLK